MSTRKLRELIVIFLELNPEPADAQVHALAAALGVDKEALEACIYKMMGEVINEEDHLIEAADADVVEELDIDPDMIPLDDVAMNDGDPTEDDIGFQEETQDDGTDVHDIGVGLSSNDSSDVLTDDGVPMPPEI